MHYFYVTFAHPVGFGCTVLQQHEHLTSGEVNTDGFNIATATRHLTDTFQMAIVIQDWKQITERRYNDFTALLRSAPAPKPGMTVIPGGKTEESPGSVPPAETSQGAGTMCRLLRSVPAPSEPGVPSTPGVDPSPVAEAQPEAGQELSKDPLQPGEGLPPEA